MSKFGKHGIQKAMDAAAALSVNRYMERETAENLKYLRQQLAGEKV